MQTSRQINKIVGEAKVNMPTNKTFKTTSVYESVYEDYINKVCSYYKS